MGGSSLGPTSSSKSLLTKSHTSSQGDTHRGPFFPRWSQHACFESLQRFSWSSPCIIATLESTLEPQETNILLLSCLDCSMCLTAWSIFLKASRKVQSIQLSASCCCWNLRECLLGARPVFWEEESLLIAPMLLKRMGFLIGEQTNSPSFFPLTATKHPTVGATLDLGAVLRCENHETETIFLENQIFCALLCALPGRSRSSPHAPCQVPLFWSLNLSLECLFTSRKPFSEWILVGLVDVRIIEALSCLPPQDSRYRSKKIDFQQTCSSIHLLRAQKTKRLQEGSGRFGPGAKMWALWKPLCLQWLRSSNWETTCYACSKAILALKEGDQGNYTNVRYIYI